VHILVTGGSRADRLSAVATQPEYKDAASFLRCPIRPAILPFLRSIPPLPVGQPRLIRIDDIEAAFPNNQQAGVRLVLTQSTYCMQRLLDRLGPADRVIATADRIALEQGAPEAFSRRGPWRFFRIVRLPMADSPPPPRAADEHPAPDQAIQTAQILADAFQRSTVEERLAICRRVSDAEPRSAVAALCLASACRESGDASAARTALDAALRLAPDWEAIHYEDGKFWLGCDDMDRAREGFQRAADLMPTFSAAFSNLGATLGELDRAEEAVAALARAVEHDPESFTVWNNIGVVNRELGRLQESEQAFLRVVTLAPEFVFGYYNLGHTRFLRGDYVGALAAYENGQARDVSRNRRQAARLALVRFANHDVVRAERELWQSVDAAAPDERRELLQEAYEITVALMTAHPALAEHKAFLDRISRQLN
jgi:tetratricopeptide (TPR) repeat protein